MRTLCCSWNLIWFSKYAQYNCSKSGVPTAKVVKFGVVWNFWKVWPFLAISPQFLVSQQWQHCLMGGGGSDVMASMCWIAQWRVCTSLHRYCNCSHSHRRATALSKARTASFWTLVTYTTATHSKHHVARSKRHVVKRANMAAPRIRPNHDPSDPSSRNRLLC